MTRKEGFIEVDKMLQKIGVDTTYLGSILNSPLINIIKNDSNGLHFSFDYLGETYFFKYNIDFFGKEISPYNDLIVEELAEDFGIACVEYDLAILGSKRGVLSKNFKKLNTNYVLGENILRKCTEYYDSSLDNDSKKSYRYTTNTLDDIWDKLEIRYPNQREIISKLMRQIINIYLFDIITCQSDRHDQNWQIMESENDIDIAPIYNNERILWCSDKNACVNLGVDTIRKSYENLWDSIQKFQGISSEEFTNIIKEKLWIISEENLHKVFERIERKTGYPMPEKRKNFYLINYQEHKKGLEEILGKEDVKKR